MALNEPEERLARIEAGYPTASAASCLGAFLLPQSLQFAEYNAESPAGPGYSETLAEVFSSLPVMSRFLERFRVCMHPLVTSLLEALESAEVGILCLQPLPGELAARLAIVSVVERRQIRYAHMVGVTPHPIPFTPAACALAGRLRGVSARPLIRCEA